ncbi:MAG: hemerythrin domain-containing protein [Ramlibacter sp.]
MPHLATNVIREEHTALAAMLRSLLLLIDNGPGDQPERFFDVLRAMLFYIDEFPERMHHPKESKLLFPMLVRAEPGLAPVIERLERDHAAGEHRVRELQHLLLAWELVGDGRRTLFMQAAQQYVKFYLEHMHCEETQLLTVAERVLTTAQWIELEIAFCCDKDPLAGGRRDPSYDRLFTRIVMAAPAPIGVGPAMDKPAHA